MAESLGTDELEQNLNHQKKHRGSSLKQRRRERCDGRMTGRTAGYMDGDGPRVGTVQECKVSDSAECRGVRGRGGGWIQ